MSHKVGSPILLPPPRRRKKIMSVKSFVFNEPKRRTVSKSLVISVNGVKCLETFTGPVRPVNIIRPYLAQTPVSYPITPSSESVDYAGGGLSNRREFQFICMSFSLTMSSSSSQMGVMDNIVVDSSRASRPHAWCSAADCYFDRRLCRRTDTTLSHTSRKTNRKNA